MDYYVSIRTSIFTHAHETMIGMQKINAIMDRGNAQPTYKQVPEIATLQKLGLSS